MPMSSLLVKAAFLAASLAIAQSCSCAFTTFNQHYCRSTTVVLGKVLAKFDNCPGTCSPGGDQINGRIIYIVKVLKTFKGKAPEDGIMYLKTAVNGALCGVYLPLNKKFVFFLDDVVKSPKECPREYYHLSLCGGLYSPASLSKDNLKLLKNPKLAKCKA